MPNGVLKWQGTRIAQGKKEEIPSDCPPPLKKIIRLCWEINPAQRPAAIQVLADLKPLVEQKISSPYDAESEIKKLKAQMEQMQLAHERQLTEEKQRLTLEKQQLEMENKPKLSAKQKINNIKLELKTHPGRLTIARQPVYSPISTQPPAINIANLFRKP